MGRPGDKTMRTSILHLSTALVLATPLASGCFNASDAPLDDAGLDDEGGSTGAMADDGSDDGPGPGTTTTPPDPTDADGDGSTGSDDSADTMDPDTSGGEEVDTTPPTVVSSLPADASVGVFADQIISIQFSEPMDKASVQTAYQSAQLPDLLVNMNWNEAGDQLIITPNQPLVYGYATSPTDLNPNSYALSISTAATDLAGNELEMDVDIEFTMLNYVSEDIDLLGSLTGSMRQGAAWAFGIIQAGDSGNPPNLQYRGFASFPLYDLPTEIVEIVDATLLSTQYLVAGTPYTDLGDLEIHDVEYTQVGNDAFITPSLGNLGVLSDDASMGQKALHVAEAVAADFDAGSDTTQFAYQFPLNTNGEAAADYVGFRADDAPATQLRVEYLLP
jgi:hypothetical protein